MPDYGTTSPAAGWYTDPANATLERWWGGVEWTHDTRPIAVVAAPEPAFAGVPGGGINPFAGEVQAETSRLATYDPASAFSTAPTRSFGTSSTQPQISQSWYSEPSRAWQQQPTNGVATAGLVLSILGISAIGIICSAIGISKARAFESRGQAPVGRKRSRWGLGLGIAAIVLNLALTTFYVLNYPTIMAWATNYAIENSSLLQGEVDAESSAPTDRNPGVLVGYPEWDHEQWESDYSDGFASTHGYPPDYVACPPSIFVDAGSSFICQASWDGQTHELEFKFLDDEGAMEHYLDGVLVEQ